MNLVLAITGASGAHAAQLLLEKSPWPVTLVASGMRAGAKKVSPLSGLVRAMLHGAGPKPAERVWLAVRLVKV